MGRTEKRGLFGVLNLQVETSTTTAGKKPPLSFSPPQRCQPNEASKIFSFIRLAIATHCLGLHELEANWLAEELFVAHKKEIADWINTNPGDCLDAETGLMPKSLSRLLARSIDYFGDQLTAMYFYRSLVGRSARLTKSLQNAAGTALYIHGEPLSRVS